MKVLILTQGTRGDVQFFAALAQGLNLAGHEVVFGGPSSTALLAEKYSVRTYKFDDVMAKAMADPFFCKWMESNNRGIRGMVLAMKSRRKKRSIIDEYFLDDLESVIHEDADLVVHHVTIPGHDIAEYLGVPAVPVCVEPSWHPTSSFTNPWFPCQLPRPLNRASYFPSLLGWQLWPGRTKAWRAARLGLRSRRGYRNVFRRPDGGPATVLQAFSRHVLPNPLDYPDWVHTTGYWFLPSPKDWVPPSELSTFLDGGDPPVYIGFGSMVVSDQARSWDLIAKAVQIAKVRAVVVTGWSDIKADRRHVDEVLQIQDAPLDWLFPRMAAVVHHGGAGTTGAAFAAGRPQVVCPFQMDQVFWAKRAYRSGVAPEPLPQYRLNAEELGWAIRRTVDDWKMKKNAESLGLRIRGENGVGVAVKTLESVI